MNGIIRLEVEGKIIDVKASSEDMKFLQKGCIIEVRANAYNQISSIELLNKDTNAIERVIPIIE